MPALLRALAREFAIDMPRPQHEVDALYGLRRVLNDVGGGLMRARAAAVHSSHVRVNPTYGLGVDRGVGTCRWWAARL
jgi:hypothetical protein